MKLAEMTVDRESWRWDRWLNLQDAFMVGEREGIAINGVIYIHIKEVDIT